MKEQDKTSGKDLNGMLVSNLSDNEFKVIFIKMITTLRRRMEKH